MIKRVGLALSIIVGLATLILPAGRVWAASATLYLSPASGSVINGNTIAVNVRENSGTQTVNAVQANLSYPANLFDVTTINSSSAFNVIAQNSYGNGSIQIGRGAMPSVSGDQLVATVVFKAKASSGVATVNFTSGSEVAANDGNGTNILSGTSGGSYSLSAPASSGVDYSAPASGSAASPKTKISGSGSTSQAPAKDVTPPVLSNVKVDTTPNTAVISWNTSEPATSEIDYGINNRYGLVAVDNQLVTAHHITLDSPIIAPATLYHFMVKSTDSSGNLATSGDSTFMTKGGVLNVTVVNQKNSPVAGAIVSFGGQTARTDKAGKATLDYLPAGKLTGTVEFKGDKTAETVDIKSADPLKPQITRFQIHTTSSKWLIFILPLLLVGIVITCVLYYRRRNSPPPGSGSTPNAADLPQAHPPQSSGPSLADMPQGISLVQPPTGPVLPPANNQPTYVPQAQVGPAATYPDQPEPPGPKSLV